MIIVLSLAFLFLLHTLMHFINLFLSRIQPLRSIYAHWDDIRSTWRRWTIRNIECKISIEEGDYWRKDLILDLHFIVIVCVCVGVFREVIFWINPLWLLHTGPHWNGLDSVKCLHKIPSNCQRTKHRKTKVKRKPSFLYAVKMLFLFLFAILYLHLFWTKNLLRIIAVSLFVCFSSRRIFLELLLFVFAIKFRK